MAGDHAKAIIKMADKHLPLIFTVPPPVEPAGQHSPVLYWGSAAGDGLNL